MASSLAQSDDREERYGEFVSLLARHDVAIRRFIRSLLPSSEGVDDVLQETALECWRKFADFQPTDADGERDAFIRWACVIARFKVMSWQRERQRDRLVFRDGVVERLAEAAVEQVANQETLRIVVETCLKQLPEQDRELVLSIHSPGQSVAAIAERTGQSARRLYSKLNALRKTLQSCVSRKVSREGADG